jgi:hypothetical protein
MNLRVNAQVLSGGFSFKKDENNQRWEFWHSVLKGNTLRDLFRQLKVWIINRTTVCERLLLFFQP